MDASEWISLASRWLHILAAVTAVGGTIFARLVVYPTLAQLPDDQRRTLHAELRRRFAPLVHASIGILLVTGLYNIVGIERTSRPPVLYHAMFGVKFLLAMGIFFIASLLLGRSQASERFRQRAAFWLTVNLALAVVLILISGFLRSYHTEGLPPKLPATSATNAGG